MTSATLTAAPAPATEPPAPVTPAPGVPTPVDLGGHYVDVFEVPRTPGRGRAGYQGAPHDDGGISALPRQAIADQVAQKGYAIVRGLVDPVRLRNARSQIRRAFSPIHDTAPVGTPPDAAMRNFQKVVLGGGSQTGYHVPRCVRVIYNPLWADDLYGMREVFRPLARLRNHLLGFDLDYAVDRVEDGLFTAARLQHYPAGGGFFAAHEDRVVETINREAGVARFFQLVLLLTEKGKDFRDGGAFVEKDGERIDLETRARAGDVLIYDGRSRHGVGDIDPHRVPDLRALAGRLVALASLYRDMTHGDADYDYYLSRIYPTG